jgi:hypothetical protein
MSTADSDLDQKTNMLIAAAAFIHADYGGWRLPRPSGND